MSQVGKKEGREGRRKGRKEEGRKRKEGEREGKMEEGRKSS
jgi:hypothetical protein